MPMSPPFATSAHPRHGRRCRDHPRRATARRARTRPRWFSRCRRRASGWSRPSTHRERGPCRWLPPMPTTCRLVKSPARAMRRADGSRCCHRHRHRWRSSRHRRHKVFPSVAAIMLPSAQTPKARNWFSPAITRGASAGAARRWLAPIAPINTSAATAQPPTPVDGRDPIWNTDPLLGTVPT